MAHRRIVVFPNVIMSLCRLVVGKYMEGDLKSQA